MTVILVSISGGTCEGDYWRNTVLIDLDLLSDSSFKTEVLYAFTRKTCGVVNPQDVPVDFKCCEVTDFPVIIQAKVDIMVS